MYTKEQLKSEVIAYIANNEKELIEKIYTNMYKAAKAGQLCLYKYHMSNEDVARRMCEYFKYQGFQTEYTWSKWNDDKNIGENWYINIHWF